jgi:quercetin dioxygenase-like cupin family protein
LQRAVLTLGPLLKHRQRKPSQARTLLAAVYRRFTEGFDTTDVVSVKTLPESFVDRKDERNCHENDAIMTIAALIATTGLSLHAGQAQQVGARRIDLQRHDLSVTGREVIQTIVELAPGTTAPRHTHPGEEIIYVLEGMWEYTVDGKPPVTLKAGDVLFIPAGTIHSARNVATGHAAELATYIVEKGKPLITVVQ